jgi:hypothetical protein
MLSEQERRQLKDIEQRLRDDDPVLARRAGRLTSCLAHHPQRSRLRVPLVTRRGRLAIVATTRVLAAAVLVTLVIMAAASAIAAILLR